jgi:hypothetical protein
MGNKFHTDLNNWTKKQYMRHQHIENWLHLTSPKKKSVYVASKSITKQKTKKIFIWWRLEGQGRK